MDPTDEVLPTLLPEDGNRLGFRSGVFCLEFSVMDRLQQHLNLKLRVMLRRQFMKVAG